MAFEHEQFRRFLQNDGNCPPSPSPSPTKWTRPSPTQQQQTMNGAGQQMKRPRRHSNGKKVSWTVGDSGGGRGGRKRCEPLTAQGRVAALVVCLKLALLCCWLIHELASGFDESTCLAVASLSQTTPQNQQQMGADNNGGNEAAAANPSDKKDILPPAAEVEEPIKVVEWQRDDTTADNPAWEGPKEAEAAPKSSGDANSSPPSSSASSDADHQQSSSTGQSSPVPKRRRKVILRRRLLRKGATRSSQHIHQDGLHGLPRPAKNGGGGGAVRRVVWRIVPLRKLPSDGESTEEEQMEGGGGMEQKESDGPMRTKTGTVILRRATEGGGGGKLRRIARRRTITAGGNIGGGRHGDAGLLDLSMIRSEWRGGEHAAGQSGHRPGLAIYAALSVPDQLDQLVAAILCYARTILDCWCLVQCFCMALFLLGLHIRHQLLAMFAIVVDVVSIVLALIFGISTLMFPLILLFLLPNLPSRPLLLCFGLSALVHLAVALFAWTTFLQLKAVNMAGDGEEAGGRSRKCGDILL